MYSVSHACLPNKVFAHYSTLKSSVVWPLRVLSGLKESMLPPVKREGIVFYVYSLDFCRNGNRYMEQLKFNMDAIHEKDPSVRD